MGCYYSSVRSLKYPRLPEVWNTSTTNTVRCENQTQWRTLVCAPHSNLQWLTKLAVNVLWCCVSTLTPAVFTQMRISLQRPTKTELNYAFSQKPLGQSLLLTGLFPRWTCSGLSSISSKLEEFWTHTQPVSEYHSRHPRSHGAHTIGKLFNWALDQLRERRVSYPMHGFIRVCVVERVNTRGYLNSEAVHCHYLFSKWCWTPTNIFWKKSIGSMCRWISQPAANSQPCPLTFQSCRMQEYSLKLLLS